MATLLTPKQKKFKKLSNETRHLIKYQLNAMLNDVIESVYTAQCEQDSPNSPDFWNQNEELLSTANEYILAVLNGEEG